MSLGTQDIERASSNALNANTPPCQRVEVGNDVAVTHGFQGPDIPIKLVLQSRESSTQVDWVYSRIPRLQLDHSESRAFDKIITCLVVLDGRKFASILDAQFPTLYK